MTESVDTSVKNIEIVMNLINSFSEPRKSRVKKMIEDSPVGEFYFTAPASTKEEYHNAFPGGLCSHSLNVVSNLWKLCNLLTPGKYKKEVISFVGLFHDLGKAGDGVNPYYIENSWLRGKSIGIPYEINKNCLRMPNSELGLFVLQKFDIQLSDEEWLAIRLNDGMYDESNKKYAMKEPDLALLLHWADRWSVSKEKQ